MGWSPNPDGSGMTPPQQPDPVVRQSALDKLMASLAEPALQEKAMDAICRIADAAEVLVFHGGRELGRIDGRLDALVRQVDGLLQGTPLQTSEDDPVAMPHSDPADCPTWHDWCHCTVENLEWNIARSEKAEEWLDKAKTTVTNLEADLQQAQALLSDAQTTAANAIMDREALEHSFDDAREGLLAMGVAEEIVEAHLGAGVPE